MIDKIMIDDESKVFDKLMKLSRDQNKALFEEKYERYIKQLRIKWWGGSAKNQRQVLSSGFNTRHE